MGKQVALTPLNQLVLAPPEGLQLPLAHTASMCRGTLSDPAVLRDPACTRLDSAYVR